jgi:hypothetical protein
VGGSGFDAAAVAAEAVSRGEDPIATLVGTLAGAVSVCWESPGGAGVFDSERAAALVEDAVEWLRAHRVVAPLRPHDRVLVWLTGHGSGGGEMEDAATAVRAFLSGAGEDRVMVVDADAAQVAVFSAAEPPRAQVHVR